MSFPTSRGRGRGSSRGTRSATAPRNAPSGPSHGNTNGNAPTGPARGGITARATFGAAGRGNGAQVPRGGRGGGGASRGASFKKPPSRRAANGGAMSGGPLKDRYEQLKKIREMERKDAERKGIVSAPGQARLLADAVTPVGTCLDMCAEWERVERAFQNSVAPEELDPDKSAFTPGTALPVEARMVKKFKRPGAGDGDQLPSDLRPPHVLKMTCDYLFHDLLTNAPSLASVHGFIWDRTRAIRNDFSIQQVTKLEDVRIAIECFERIARFHILALHEMATPESQQQARRAEMTYDPQQEREQLDRTLLSLMQYYDDYRGRIDLVNEAEFRSYCVLFQLDSSQTDTEDRVQSWPNTLVGDRKIQVALQLYAAACTTLRRLGPFKSLATEHVLARQDWETFWNLVKSTKTSYLQACVAEIYFHLLRDMVLRSIVRAMRSSKPVNGRSNPSTEWSMHDLRDLFYFDDDEQLVAFCALYDLDFHEVDDEDYLDISPVAGRNLQTPNFAKSIQKSSWIVEQKRHGRSWAAVIDGMNVQQAQDAGMVDETIENQEMADVTGEEGDASGEEDPESLFIPEVQNSSSMAAQNPSSSSASGFTSASPFGQAAATSGITFGQPQPQPSTFGQPSGGPSLGTPSPFGQPTSTTQATGFGFNVEKKTFDFLNSSAAAQGPAAKPTTTGASASPSMTPASLFSGAQSKLGSLGEPSIKPATQPFAQPSIDGTPSLFAPKKDATASASLSNPFGPFNTAPTPSNPFLAPTAVPSASQEKPAPAFSFSKPEPAQNVPSLFSGFSAPAAPSVEEPNFKSTAASLNAPPQPSASSSTTTSTSTTHTAQEASSSTLHSGSQSPPRRTSINNLPDTKPKKPSPLSHSFTASEENSSLSRAPQINSAPASHPVEEPFPGRQNTGLPRSFTQTKPAAQTAATQQAAPDFDAIITRIAQELTTDPVSGFLKQYVDYTVKQVITKVQEDLYWERMNSEADEFRSWFLQDKFGKRWRDTCRRQRLAKQGRERRKRAQKRLHESQRSDAHDIGDLVDTASSLRSSVAGSIASHQSKREMVDALYKSTMGGSRFSGDRQAQAGSKRSVSSQLPDPALSSTDTGHKRMKSTSHVDDHGRVAKPLSATNPNADMLKRSSFLNFSLASDARNRSSTTQSTYFRMKALGVKQSADSVLGLNRGTKRPRSDSMDTDGATPTSRFGSSSLGSSPDHTRGRNDGLMQPPSTRSVRSRTNDDDEALFARLKAAREDLRDGQLFMKTEVEKDEDLRRSASSLSDRESPSLARARAEVLFQASQADSDFGASISGREVPAYRLRESRFVPREHYPRARERASEILASRSEQASKSEPGAGQSSLDLPNEQKLSNGTQPTPVVTSLPQTGCRTAKTNGTFPKVASPLQPLSGFDGAHPGLGGSGFYCNAPLFSPSAAPAPPMANGVANPFLQHSFTQESQNPFLQAPVSNGTFISQTQSNAMSTPAPQPTYNFGFGAPAPSASHDNSIQPLQIDEALSRTFGQPPHDRPNPFAPLPPQATSSHPVRGTSEAISLVSDDEDVAEVGNKIEQTNNGMDAQFGDGQETQSYEPETFKPYASANRFALLDGNDEDEKSQESASVAASEQPLNGEADEKLDSDDDQTEVLPDSYQYDDGETEEYESDNGEDFEGDGQVDAADEGADFYSDEESEDAEDEMEYDSEEGGYDEDDEEGRPFVPQAAFGHPRPQPNAALQVVGNNVEEAIELSD